jgi:hypothetical protein
VFASGIWTLAMLSGALLVAVGGNTLTLIPLYVVVARVPVRVHVHGRAAGRYQPGGCARP